jgi:hypothetical protein
MWKQKMQKQEDHFAFYSLMKFTMRHTQFDKASNIIVLPNLLAKLSNRSSLLKSKKG